MADAEFDPNKLANPASGFRFPPKTSLPPDLACIEIRHIIIGWVKEIERLATVDGGLQEMRDSLQRLNELMIALSARAIAVTVAREEEQQEKARATVTRKPRRKGSQP